MNWPNFSVRWEDSLKTVLNDSIVYVAPPPSGGVLTALILNIMQGYNSTSKSIESEKDQILTAHRFVEAFKYGNLTINY